MKRWIIGASASALLITCSIRYFESNSASAAHLPLAGKPYIARWHDDARAAISFTFDDGLQTHADIAAPMLCEFAFKGTFYIVPGLTRTHKSEPLSEEWNARQFHFGEAAISWEEIRHMRDLGMEIGNHSLSHTFLNKITDDHALAREIDRSADLIAENLGGQRPVTFAFPYNEYTPHAKSMVLKHHLAVRENWTDYGGPAFTTEIANSHVNNAIRSQAWLVPMIHGIDGGFLPLSSAVFRQHLAFIKNRSRELWVDTYATVARYQFQREAATLHIEDSEPGELTFRVSADSRHSAPLTVVLPLPLGEHSDDVDARLENTDDSLEISREPDRILIDIPANSASIRVTWH